MKTEKAHEYRLKYGLEMPSAKLARILYAENPLLYRDVEDARKHVRNVEGKAYRNRKSMIEVSGERPKNPYKLPVSDAKEYEPFEIDGQRILILSDVHIPYHDVDAITAIFDFCKGQKFDGILLNGDILDFYNLSRFSRDPKARSVDGELKLLWEFYHVLQEQFNCQIYYKFGNHEERYDHFLHMKAAELSGVEEFSLVEVIGRRLPGAVLIKDKRIVRFGQLSIIHGHEYSSGIFQSVNVARGLFLKSKVSSLQGHAHQVSEHTETDLHGRITTTWSVGCLCDLHPDYAKLNKWSQGFAIAEKDGKGFTVKNYRIHQGKVL